MLAILRRLPRLFATTDDHCSIMAKMDEATAERLVVYVATPNSVCFMAELDENDLSEVKTGLKELGNWTHFFEVMRDAFNNNKVTVSKCVSGANSEDYRDVDKIRVACCAKDPKQGSITFCLKKTDMDIWSIIVNNLLDTQQMPHHVKEKEQALRKIEKELAQAIIRVEHLEKESSVLKENRIIKQERDSLNMKRIEELKVKLSELQKCNNCEMKGARPPAKSVPKKTAGPAAGVGVPASQCRLRKPLGNANCKKYDSELLRLIKSRWSDGKKGQNSTYNSVIVPYTAAELAKKTKQLKPEHEAIWEALSKIDDWDYNIFEIQVLMSSDDYASLPNQPEGGSLFITMYALLVKYGFLQKFGMDEQVVLNWISHVEAGYHGNPYHNSMHAADVLHVTHYILSKGGMAKRCNLSDRQVFAALFAAGIHDYNHPGINNNFHVKSQSYYATLYNDRSVLENMHVANVFELMKEPQLNILASFSEEDRREIRDIVIEMVLATDMGMHEKWIARFKRRISEGASFTEREDQMLALAIALKMADISNCGRPLDIYLKWSGKVSDEFFMQGDRERSLGMPCSPFMDRLEPSLAKGQISFMSYIILPFFEMLVELLPDMRIAVQCAERSKAYWMNAGNNDGTG